MHRLLPSLSALGALEAAARLGSFTKAGEELSLTQGSISRQIKLVEMQLGIALFERIRGRVVITEAGLFYAEQIREALDGFAAATARAMSFRTASGVLRLSMLPTFGTKWLIPRLADFFTKHRGVTISFSSHIRQVDFQRDRLDAAIHFGEPEWPGVILHRLVAENLIAVASPKLIKRDKIKRPEDVGRATLLIHATRPKAWTNWFRANGLRGIEPAFSLEFEEFAMVRQAAVAELGVALVPKVLVQDELASGELTQLCGRSVDGNSDYFLAYPRARASFPPLVAFRDWLLGQIDT